MRSNPSSNSYDSPVSMDSCCPFMPFIWANNKSPLFRRLLTSGCGFNRFVNKRPRIDRSGAACLCWIGGPNDTGPNLYGPGRPSDHRGSAVGVWWPLLRYAYPSLHPPGLIYVDGQFARIRPFVRGRFERTGQVRHLCAIAGTGATIDPNQ